MITIHTTNKTINDSCNDSNDNINNKFRFDWMDMILFKYVINKVMNVIYNGYGILLIILIKFEFVLLIGYTMFSLFCIVIGYGLLLIIILWCFN